MCKIKKVIGSLIIALAFFANSAQSQNSENLSALSSDLNCYKYKETFWFTLGVDPILLSAGHMSLNYVAMPNLLLSVRTAGVNDTVARAITLIGLFDGAEYTSDAGVLCGWLYNGESSQFSASTGIAYVQGGKHEALLNNEIRYSTIGVPLEIQAFWKPFDHFGLGIIGFGNINSKKSFGGAVLALRISF